MKEEPRTCPNCGREIKYDSDEYCSQLCEMDAIYGPPPKTKAQVIRMGTDKNGDRYVAE